MTRPRFLLTRLYRLPTRTFNRVRRPLAGAAMRMPPLRVARSVARDAGVAPHVGVLAALCLLAGCGQKGPLVLPGAEQRPLGAPSVPGESPSPPPDDEEQEEDEQAQ